jgi:hypothetical protein
VSWGPLEELAALFNPGMRHEQERREKLSVLREDEGNSADPPSHVDLDAGVAVLRLPGKKPAEPASAEPAKAEPAKPRPVKPKTVRSGPAFPDAVVDDQPAVRKRPTARPSKPRSERAPKASTD